MKNLWLIFWIIYLVGRVCHGQGAPMWLTNQISISTTPPAVGSGAPMYLTKPVTLAGSTTAVPTNTPGPTATSTITPTPGATQVAVYTNPSNLRNPYSAAGAFTTDYWLFGTSTYDEIPANLSGAAEFNNAAGIGLSTDHAVSSYAGFGYPGTYEPGDYTILTGNEPYGYISLEYNFELRVGDINSFTDGNYSYWDQETNFYTNGHDEFFGNGIQPTPGQDVGALVMGGAKIFDQFYPGFIIQYGGVAVYGVTVVQTATPYPPYSGAITTYNSLLTPTIYPVRGGIITQN